ncbi:MAG: hypothetical protein GXO02_01415 [Epsilonproteobacteria bacterium]|nr:hypothetical protein [Campylobacterota bacterium]
MVSKRAKKILGNIIAIAIVLFYPMLISIYVKLPLFIGFSGYLIVLGVKRERYIYSFFAFLYLLNLELNLSLPLLLTTLAVVLFYLFFYEKLIFLKRCEKCVALISVVMIDLIYFFLLLIHDFIFTQSSIGINPLLLFSLIFDIIAAVLL